MKLLLDSLVQSHIYYALPVWGASLRLQLSSRLKRLQNRAVRLAFSLKRYDHVSDYYKQLNWLPLDQFIKFCSICSMYKQFHQRCCIPLEPPIQFGNPILITPEHLGNPILITPEHPHRLQELFGIS